MAKNTDPAVNQDYPQIIKQVTEASNDAFRVIPINGIVDVQFDAITVDYPSATEEVYEYRVGGLAGTVVKTVTVTYTDASKVSLQSVEVQS